MKAKALAVAAILALAPAAVFAQDAQTPAAPSTTTPTGADAGGIATDFDMFLQGFGAADFTSAQSEIDTATNFNVVKISTLANADATRLEGAIGPHEADIAGLSSRIEANAAAKSALDAQGVAASDVVWVETGADGTMTLYVNDLG